VGDTVTEHGAPEPWSDPDPDWAAHEEQPDAAAAWPDPPWPDRFGADGPDDHDGPDPDEPDEPLQAGPEPVWERAAPGEFPDHHGDPPGYGPDGDGGPPPDTAGPGMGHVGADPDAIDAGAIDAGGADGFPPPLDVGALPEPVDGFPWIDADALGTAAGPGGPPGVPDPAGLAAYAGEPVPPGADPWAHLAASDDPATAALARFWGPQS
jgi:hypothetical protein